ncbi:hypothetical protein ACHAWF_004867 [Thalassiosira exigua]
MDLLDAPASSPAATPPSSPALLSDIEALERGALMCLASFKLLDGDSWGAAPRRAAPVSPMTVVEPPTPVAAAPPPSLPPKKRILRAYVAPIDIEEYIVDSDLSDPDYEPPRKKKKLGRKPMLPFAEPPAKKLEAGVEVAPEASEVAPPSSLYAPGDEDRINPTHNVLRRDVLELFVEPSRGGRARFAGKVGLRCRFCKHLPDRDRAPLSTVYPETLGGIYRACSVRFQKRHLTQCAHVPRRVREELDALGSSNARGSKGHWIQSAKKKGLRDCEGGKQKGIVFRPELVDV